MADVHVAGRPRKHHLEEVEDSRSRRTRTPDSGRPDQRSEAPSLPAPEQRERVHDARTPERRRTATGRFDPDADRLREECGVFGIFGHPDAAAITALGLHALQHRGQEAAGIVSFDGKRFHSERRLGLVGDNFSRREVIDRLPGTTAVGHVRYSTTGETILRNVQPLFAELERAAASPSAITAT